MKRKKKSAQYFELQASLRKNCLQLPLRGKKHETENEIHVINYSTKAM